MGYSHCDKHDECATNGCDSCEREALECMRDWEVIYDAAYRYSPSEDLRHLRMIEIAERMKLDEGRGQRMGEESKQEMVTIEVPLEQAEHVLEHGQPKNCDGEIWVSACKAALDARKSKYERWCEFFAKGWKTAAGWESDGYCQTTAKLIASAPEMVKALVKTSKMVERDDGWKHVFDAIKLALPEYVIDEVFGGK